MGCSVTYIYSRSSLSAKISNIVKKIYKTLPHFSRQRGHARVRAARGIDWSMFLRVNTWTPRATDTRTPTLLLALGPTQHKQCCELVLPRPSGRYREMWSWRYCYYDVDYPLTYTIFNIQKCFIFATAWYQGWMSSSKPKYSSIYWTFFNQHEHKKYRVFAGIRCWRARAHTTRGIALFGLVITSDCTHSATNTRTPTLLLTLELSLDSVICWIRDPTPIPGSATRCDHEGYCGYDKNCCLKCNDRWSTILMYNGFLLSR